MDSQQAYLPMARFSNRMVKCEPRSMMRPSQEGVCGVKVQWGNSRVQPEVKALHSRMETFDT